MSEHLVQYLINVHTPFHFSKWDCLGWIKERVKEEKSKKLYMSQLSMVKKVDQIMGVNIKITEELSECK